MLYLDTEALCRTWYRVCHHAFVLVSQRLFTETVNMLYS